MKSLLSMAFREQVKTTKDISMINEMTYSVSYPTGFLNMDFANGYIQEISGVKTFELGISDGSMNMIVSNSGLGKTTLASQMALNIIKPFPTSCIFYEQAEVGTNIQRIKNLSGLNDEDFKKKFVIRDAGVTLESVYQRVTMVHDLKINNPSQYTYDTGLRNPDGSPVYKFEPTVFIIDSVKMVLSEKLPQDETTNMTGAQTAKLNGEYYPRLVPKCREANIIVFFINHITTDVNTGFMPKPAEFPWLKQGEHISGGKALAYIQNNILRIDHKSKLKSDEGLCIEGTMVALDFVKSRTNTSGKGKCNLVFDLNTGYDNDLSLFMMLKDRKLLEGAGAFLKLPGCDIKFSQRKFKETLYTNPEFFNAFIGLCVNTLRDEMIEEYERIKRQRELEATMSPYDAMINMINSPM